MPARLVAAGAWLPTPAVLVDWCTTKVTMEALRPSSSVGVRVWGHLVQWERGPCHSAPLLVHVRVLLALKQLPLYVILLIDLVMCASFFASQTNGFRLTM